MAHYLENKQNGKSFWYDFLDSEHLQQFANSHRQAYMDAQPFPHIIIDNFFPDVILQQILEEFPKPEQIDWYKFNDATQKKLASTAELQMGKITRFFLYQLNSSIFIRFLETLTSIPNIIPDPHFAGGGLHQIERGGYLKIHSDFNYHGDFGLDRRLNLLIYLNQDWREEYGGHLELWNREMSECKQRILPIFNRCVIFSTSDYSFHGHPDPIACPEDRSRKSLAMYYYTNGRPSEEVSTSRSTLFKERFAREMQSPKSSFKQILKKFIPPIVVELKNKWLRSRK